MRRAFASVVAVLVVLVGCGDEERETVSTAKLAAAAEATHRAPSERVQVSIVLNAFARELRVTGDGVWGNRSGEGRMTLDMSGIAGIAGGPPGAASNRADVIAARGRVWIRWAPLAQRIGSGRPWVRLELDPLAQMVDGLRALEGDAEVLGKETVRGADTTRYRAAVDAKEYPELPIASDEIPVEVWVAAGSGRIHRVRARAEVALPGGPGFDVDATIELYDFGAPVGHVLPPPESETGVPP
jgi:hypothetical protein